MRYGILKFKLFYKHIDLNWKFNIGDAIQSYAIEELYNQIGINDYFLINKHETREYSGEKITLPFANLYHSEMDDDIFPISKDIVPIFVGFHHSGTVLPKERLSDLRKHQPIGCRDERTFQLMNKYGLDAYISGCVTASLNRREKGPEDGKVFIVDASTALMKHIPQNLKENATFS